VVAKFGGRLGRKTAQKAQEQFGIMPVRLNSKDVANLKLSDVSISCSGFLRPLCLLAANKQIVKVLAAKQHKRRKKNLGSCL
jgi:hypothetical protein